MAASAAASVVVTTPKRMPTTTMTPRPKAGMAATAERHLSRPVARASVARTLTVRWMATASADRHHRAADEAAGEKASDRKVGGGRQNEEGDGRRNDIVEDGGRRDDCACLCRRIAAFDQLRLEGAGAEGSIGDRRAGRSGKQHAGQKGGLGQPLSWRSPYFRGPSF